MTTTTASRKFNDHSSILSNEMHIAAPPTPRHLQSSVRVYSWLGQNITPETLQYNILTSFH